MVTNLAVKWDRNESTLPLNRWWRRLHWVRRRTSNQHITHPQHLWLHHWLFLMVLAIDLTWSNIGSVIKMQTREWNTHLLKWMNTISSLEANCYSKPLNHYLNIDCIVFLLLCAQFVPSIMLIVPVKCCLPLLMTWASLLFLTSATVVFVC